METNAQETETMATWTAAHTLTGQTFQRGSFVENHRAGNVMIEDCSQRPTLTSRILEKRFEDLLFSSSRLAKAKGPDYFARIFVYSNGRVSVYVERFDIADDGRLEPGRPHALILSKASISAALNATRGAARLLEI